MPRSLTFNSRQICPESATVEITSPTSARSLLSLSSTIADCSCSSPTRCCSVGRGNHFPNSPKNGPLFPPLVQIIVGFSNQPPSLPVCSATPLPSHAPNRRIATSRLPTSVPQCAQT